MSEPEPIVAVTVRQLVLAPAERAFDAFLVPTEIGQWMFGPNVREEKILHLKTEPKIEGGFSFLVERNGKQIDHVGRYLFVKKPVHLAFTWAIEKATADDDIIDVRFIAERFGTLVQLTHRLPPEWAPHKDKVEAAWAKMLSALARHLAKSS